ncbi:hypothetical protein SK571_45285 [Lentzea sp. BCCO 10_0798]|uniref:Uncharacterized protein n=1 Tax=Lentzea kristufekii TaxID=3095430 RepID=A0ABU4U814_9PSEU|nr:hypothetical protein [Lentzea sp. BCCO 10_0798]MDX8056627.1 hypothetical protein [Lentzea sp. BCCO 10_0798]
MSAQNGRGESLHRAKVTAGWLSVAFLLGLLCVAVDRGPNQAYIALVALTIVMLVTALVTGLRRHSRRRIGWHDTNGEASTSGTHREKGLVHDHGVRDARNLSG